MLKNFIRAEKIKIPWLLIILLLVGGGIINSAVAVITLTTTYQSITWMDFYTYSVNFHAMFFFPLMTGIIVSLLCRYEHIGGNWKLILTRPYARKRLYITKIIWISLILFLYQCIFLICFYITGELMNTSGIFPTQLLFKCLILGMVSIVPLIALQLGITIHIKNFATSLVFIIGMVVPNIVITGMHSIIGSWFPSALPFYLMMPGDSPFSPRADLYNVYPILIITLFIYSFWGYRYFVKKEWS